MPKKKKSLVDSFVFRQAKEAVDNLSGSQKDSHKKSSIISVSEQHQKNSRKESDKDHVKNSSKPVTDHINLSLKDHDYINSKNKIKSIRKVSAPLSLSKKQSQIYLWLKNRGETGEFNKPEIQNSLSIPYITVRKAIEKLVTIDVLQLDYDNCQKIYYYKLNLNKKIKLSKNISLSDQDHIRIISSHLNNSSSLSNKNTTTLKNIETILSSDPELGYWEDINLKPKQIQKWIEELQISLEDVIESLKHCRFDLIDNGLLESKPVRDPLSWIYKRLKQYGFYHAPKGYISLEDKALKRAKERLKKKQERAKELAAIREAELETERRIEFEKMLNDPECELYKTCYAKLNNVEKRLKNKGFVRCMRSAFEKLVEESPFENQ